MEDLSALAVDAALSAGATFADIRIEEGESTNITVLDGRTREVVGAREAGAGVRAFLGGAWGFAATNDLTARGLRRASGDAVRLARATARRSKIKFDLADLPGREAKVGLKARKPLDKVPMGQKVSLALELEAAMREAGGEIKSTQVTYSDNASRVTVANSLATRVEFPESWILAHGQVWAEMAGLRVRGRENRGGFGGYEVVEREDFRAIPGVAVAMAKRLLQSKPAPAGRFPVILDQKLTGVFSHEAFGHASEADLVLGGQSILEGRVGEKVGPEGVSIVDDPTVRGTFGYFAYDWEGTPAKRRVLVDRGVLRGFIHSLETASRMRGQTNGGARSESYQVPPIVRMSNTYFAPGDWTFEEMAKDMGKGLYLKGMQYGYVDTGKGQFMFKCDEAFEIQHGEVGQVYRDATLSGLTLEVLNDIDALGKDFMLTDPGYCGKGGQSMRTTDGGPHVRLRAIVVGGVG